jgi:phosphatidylglycerophosphatase A
MKRMLTSCFGLGFMPIASGTFGSMPVAAIFALACFFNAGRGLTSVIMVILAIGFSLACIKFAPGVIAKTGKKDPSEVVADEVAGQAVTFLGAYAAGINNILIVTAIGFLAFRFFDILKPPPCRRLEMLHEGYGILADDLMAGVYAAIVLQISVYYFV